MPNPNVDHSHRIPGWGSDLDPSRRPGIPREAVQGSPADTGPIQGGVKAMMPKVKVYHTIERPSITPVFGTTCPPHGLSGLIKDQAYKLGEDRLTRWLLLYASDRVDVVESALKEFVFGREYAPKSRKVARATAVLGGVAFLGVVAASFLKSRGKIPSDRMMFLDRIPVVNRISGLSQATA